jgi:hypothetical protein
MGWANNGCYCYAASRVLTFGLISFILDRFHPTGFRQKGK